MTDYNKLVKALRIVEKEQDCNECEAGRWHHDFNCCLFADAAAEIEALQAELEKKRTADCWGCKCEKLEPKRGEWVRVEDGESYHYECSECGELPLYSRYGDVVLSGVCPMCGAKMEVQDGSY